MEAETVGMAAAAGAFAALSGANDGGSLASLGLTVRGLPPVAALAALGAAVAAVPVVFGTAVASTLAGRLVTFEGTTGRRTLLVAIGAAVLVTLVLSVLGLPTSITLALIGGIGGAGFGAGLKVSWAALALVLAAGAVAPAAGALVARAVAYVTRWMPARSGSHVHVRRMHALAFIVLCLAYGANDGQKILAVLALVAGVPAGQVNADLPILALGGALFILGGVLGLPRYAGTIGGGVAPARPEQAVATEASAAAVVLATAAAGAPVSMTQSVTGGLVGAAWTTGRRRVRWRMVLRVVFAWVLTLPTAFAVAVLLALLAMGTS